MFFLCYHGKGGFTDAGIWNMPLDLFLWHVKRLDKQLTDENKAREAAADRMKRR
jgi:hypothetical protein